MEVIVSDGIHEGTTTVYIHLIDENDGHPIIEGINKISISEGLPTGSILTSFTVYDQDYGDSARFVNTIIDIISHNLYPFLLFL